MKKEDAPVIVEEVFDASPEKVWAALTQADQMRQWYFDNIPDFRAEVGFETLFVVENEGRTFPHRWKVTHVAPAQLIQYDWSYDDYAGDAFVTFELEPEVDKTKLRLTCTVRESFPDNVPEFTRENCVEGWNYFIKDRLKAYLDE